VTRCACLKFTKYRSDWPVHASWILLGILGAAAWAGETNEPRGFRLESAGVRVGGSPTSRSHNFHSVDVAVDWYLPWDWNLGKRWRLMSRLDSSAGWVGDPGGNAARLYVGAALLTGREGFPLSVEGGVGPTLLTEVNFDTKDFGIPFQFTSHLGVNCDVCRRVRLSYQFQHMSNAGLGSPNPGINLHLLGISYLF
jgi:hypothetical protein